MAGMVTGLVRMILDFIYVEPTCGENDNRPAIVKDVCIHFSLYSAILSRFWLVHILFVHLVPLFVLCYFALLGYNGSDGCCESLYKENRKLQGNYFFLTKTHIQLSF